jgi:signal transduction histidine kinase
MSLGARESAKILIVDDNPVVLLSSAELFRAAGFAVQEARNGAEALRLARVNRPDLILLDVMLPDIHGVELCRRMKADADLKSLFVVLLSSSQISSGNQVSGLDAGADGYLARPIENRELLARVQALLRIQQAEAALRQAQVELEGRVAERTAELAEANRALRALSLRLVEVQEAERRTLARELHDEAGQMLTGLKLVVEQALPVAGGVVRERLHEADDLIRQLIERMRSLSLELRPQILDDLGLLVALEWHFKRYTRQTNIAVGFRHSPLPHRLPTVIETALFRIAIEALTNIARHAGVSEVAVRLWADAERVRLQVEDKGKGFEVAAVWAARNSTGLSGMRERAELLGGEFTLESTAGKGTLLTVELPLTDLPSDPARSETTISK